ncbi:hypothetical protein Taro_019223 [Colocasia esculenta]|uniref:NAC domain-containing protein n=1 Tax=Colocasia esculenta TaxID=4460 RepID=A0A843UVR7_COLES|nr:hypothetical protein [Colocasia esculenta]
MFIDATFKEGKAAGIFSPHCLSCHLNLTLPAASISTAPLLLLFSDPSSTQLGSAVQRQRPLGCNMLVSGNNMSITVNGQSRIPPGFRFHPTEEELLNYYLRKKVAGDKIDLDVIREVDLNKLEPWDIQEKCKVGSTPQNDWYFFSHKDKKYPTGTRTNRATAAGFWKATGRDKVIYSSCKRIGMRKTLVFYRGRAPHGQKSDWIMHEYRLDEQLLQDSSSQSKVSCSIMHFVSLFANGKIDSAENPMRTINSKVIILPTLIWCA